MKSKEEILQELTELRSPLAEMPRRMPYVVPDGYFQSLPKGVLRAARDAEVPAGYFQNLPQAMLAAATAAQVPAKPKARIIALPPVRQWAAAAVLLVAFGIGGLFLFNARPTTTENPVAALPQEAVQEYIAANPDELDGTAFTNASVAISYADARQLSGLSDAELEAYLAEEGMLF